MWSINLIPNISPLSLNLSVMSLSSLLGVGSPDGWLLNSIIEAELLRIAGLKTSLGCTSELFRFPTETTFITVG